MGDHGVGSGYNIAAVHEAVAAAVPDRDCIVFRDRRLTYADIAERSRRFAHVLRDGGLGARPNGRAGLGSHESQHDHLAVYAHNGNEYLEAMLGAFKARVAPVNVNYRYVAEELRHVLWDSRSRAIVYQSEFAPRLAEVLADLPDLHLLIQIEDDSGQPLLPGATWYADALAGASAQLPAWSDEWSPDDLYVLYTGGTTGLPKGVLWRQGDIHLTAMGGRRPDRTPFSSLAEIARAAVETDPTVALPAPPFMHGAGHWTAFMTMNKGGIVVIQSRTDRLDGHDIATLLERERVRLLQIVGEAFARPIVEAIGTGRYDVSSVRTILSGGSVLTTATKQRLLDLMPEVTIMDAIGSSEGGSQGLQLTSRQQQQPPPAGVFSPTEGSVVVAEDRSGLLPPGHDGTGWLGKTGALPLGYLGDADRTARTFPTIAGQRMTIPGDRARLLADGTIALLGRDSATINSGGEKIFAEEVEQAVASHPGIRDVVVTGRPSPRWGQEVVALIQPHDGVVVTDDDLATAAAAHIARFKLPKAYIRVDEVRRSPAGKPDLRWAAAIAAKAGQPGQP
ncbi:AMP-binding protein [Candidatus Frankia nodulisporulans]|uniref:AMP-binding protein n=1 Tax=Candidatus Frankia nodulisporulans TaxID=2060052 RepID=UPI0013D20924|nr:AMP-binding protein [Candidatus Frankia nodulisporulans]